MPPLDPCYSFLSLPPRARNRIYELLLVRDKQFIIGKYTPSFRVDPTILRTCKQINNEAVPILYSQNTFMIDHPDRALTWFTQIGKSNLSHLNNLRLFPDPVYDAGDREGWYQLLGRLALEAKGLTNLYIFWDAEGMHSESGKDVRFIRHLGRIRSLQNVELDGYYAVK